MVNLRKGNFIFKNIPKKGDWGNLSKLIKNHWIRVKIYLAAFLEWFHFNYVKLSFFFNRGLLKRSIRLFDSGLAILVNLFTFYGAKNERQNLKDVKSVDE